MAKTYRESKPDLRVDFEGVHNDAVYRSVCILLGKITDCHTSRRAPSMKALISSDKVPAPPGPYSPGLTVGDWIFLSGQGGFDPNTGKVVSDDLAEQTEQTFNNIEAQPDDPRPDHRARPGPAARHARELPREPRRDHADALRGLTPDAGDGSSRGA